jgi:uncharacterized protein YkwD
MKKLFLVFSVAVSSFGFGQTIMANSNDIRIADSIRVSTINWNDVYTEFYSLINLYRLKHNLNQLTFDSTIVNVSKFQSDYILHNKKLTHETNITGYVTLSDRLVQFNYTKTFAAECILNSSFLLVVTMHQSIAQHILNRWINSPGHNQVLLMPNVSHMGVSISRDNLSGCFYSCLVLAQ